MWWRLYEWEGKIEELAPIPVQRYLIEKHEKQIEIYECWDIKTKK